MSPRRWRASRREGLAALLSMAVALACAAGSPPPAPAPAPAPAPEEGGARSADPAEPPPSLDTEYDDRRAGEQAAEEIEAALGLVEDPELVAYVEAVGRRLVPHAPRRAFDYRFAVVDQAAPNAFALPGGFIYVSRGVLLLANAEDELANVLAHEIIHVALRHAAARQHVAGELPGLLQLLQLPSLRAYGRDQERTADRLGQGLAALAGYDPAGMAAFLRQLELHARLELGVSPLPGFLDTHPSTVERLALVASRASQIAWTRREPLAPTRAAYLERIEGLAVGTPGHEGVFRGQRFVHPELGFTLRFPDGWETRNTHTAVGAIAPDRSAQVVLEAGGAGDDPEEAAAEWLAKATRQGLRVHAQEPVVLAGSRAWRVRGTVGGPRGTLHAVVTWIAWRGSVYRITGLARSRRSEGILVGTARSFRPAPPELVADVTEARLRVVSARAGETLSALSRRAGNTWNLQETAVMNRLFATDALAAGQLVKVAVAEPYAASAEPPARRSDPERR